MSAKYAAILASMTLAACVAPQPPAPRASAAVLDTVRASTDDGSRWAQQCEDWDEWDKRAAPFHVYGNTYHVGTCGISAILVAGPEGHVLIDSGTRDGARVVLSNIRTLGFQPENLRAVLTSHEHFDHVGGLWWIHQNSGARVFTSPEALEVIESGKADPSDPQFGMHAAMRPMPRSEVSAITPGETLEIAGLHLTPIATPGHTAGALSWQWESCEAGECRSIVYADSLSPVSADGYLFSDHRDYLAAYFQGLDRLAALDCDILLTPHPSASGMRDKLVAGDLGGAPTCAAYAASIRERLQTRLRSEMQVEDRAMQP